MLNVIRKFLPIIYLVFTVAVALYGFLSPQGKSSSAMEIGRGSAQKIGQDSFFNEINYYNSKDSLPFMHLDSSELSVAGGSRDIIFFQPKGKIYTKDQKPVEYTAYKGFFKRDTETLFLEGNVTLINQDSNVTAEHMVYIMPAEIIDAKENVKSKMRSLKTNEDILIDADEMHASLKSQSASYKGNVRGHIKRKRIYEQSIYFKSDNLYLDLVASMVELDGNVSIKNQGLTALSHRGEIFLENYNKTLKYYVLYDDVRLTEKVKSPDGTVFERRAFAEKLEGVMSEGKTILTGYPKVFQGQDVIKGNRIILRENNEIVEVDDASSNFELK